MNFSPPETAVGGSRPEQPADNIVVAGRRPKIAGLVQQVLIAAVLYVAISPYVIQFDAKFLPIVLVLLLAASVRARVKEFRRPPRVAIVSGEFALRPFPNVNLTTPAANVANIDLRAGRMMVTFRNTGLVEPQKWRSWLDGCFQKQGCHAISGRDVFSLEQVNQLRATLGLPLQDADRFVDFGHVLMRLTPRIVVTPALIAANVAVFLVVAALGGGFLLPDVPTLVEWGANYGPLTCHGQWWRLLSSMFLHFGLLHLLLNMNALRVIGPVVERLVGPLGFAVGYVVAGFFGSVASICWHDAIPSAGASGAIFGLFGMLLGLVSGRQQSIPAALIKEQRVNVVQFLLLNLALGTAIPGIDLAAHLGGFAAGCVCGFLLKTELPAAAGRRTSRALRLAGVAGIAGAIAIWLLPRLALDLLTVSDRAGQVEAAATRLFTAAIQRQESGAQTAAETSAEIKSSILPMYIDLAGQLDRIPRQNDATRERIKATMAEYVQIQIKGWELMGQSVEHADLLTGGLAELHFESAQRLLADLQPEGKNKQVRIPTNLYKEFAVLMVADQQANQACAELDKLESEGRLGRAELIAAFDRDVVGAWLGGRKRFLTAARDFPGREQPIVARIRKYIDLKGAALSLLAQAVRDGDLAKKEAGYKKLDEAGKAAKEIWPTEKKPD